MTITIKKDDDSFVDGTLYAGEYKILSGSPKGGFTLKPLKKGQKTVTVTHDSLNNAGYTIKEANSYDSWKERGNQLEKQAMADAINAFGKVAKRKDLDELAELYFNDIEFNGSEYIDAYKIVLKKYKLIDAFNTYYSSYITDVDPAGGHGPISHESVNEFGPLAGSGNTSANALDDMKRKAMKKSERGQHVYVIGGKSGTYKLSKYEDEGNTFAGYYNGIPMDLEESVNENISSPYIYQVGDLVQNVNPTCPHHGSKGIVMSVEPEELTYSVTNSGDTFKPGARLTKTLDQLEAI